MNDIFLNKKQQLLNWIISLEDEEMIRKLIEFKEVIGSVNMVSEQRAEYNVVKDDFEERFAKGHTLEESRKRTKEFIDSLPWKK